MHEPVMVREVVSLLDCRPGGTYVDATVGAGGHAAAILAASAPDGFLVGIDRDREVLALAARRLEPFRGRFSLLHGNFAELPPLLAREGRAPVDGVLLDLGVSSWQVDLPERGFSFRAPGPLDMRMDRDERRTLRDLLRETREEDLARMIRAWGEEPRARRIARALLEAQRAGAATTAELAAAVERALGGRSPRAGRLHPATRTFQALRIAVNRETEALDEALQGIPDLLAPGGRCCVLAYHSLEDRAVKQAFRRWSQPGEGRVRHFEILTKKPLRPRAEEVQANPRARSARLRAVRRAA